MGPQPGRVAWQPRERCRVQRACAGARLRPLSALGWWLLWERASTLLAVSDQTQPVSGETRLVLSQPLASTSSMSLIGAFRSSIVTPRSLTSTDSGLLAMPMPSPPLRSGCRTATPWCTPGTKSCALSGRSSILSLAPGCGRREGVGRGHIGRRGFLYRSDQLPLNGPPGRVVTCRPKGSSAESAPPLHCCGPVTIGVVCEV